MDINHLSEYNIIFSQLKRLKESHSSIREQITGITMVSKCNFDNVTYDWSCNLYALSGLPWNMPYIIWTTSIFHCFPVFCRHLCMFTSISRQNQTVGDEKNLLAIQVNVCYILKHLEDGKAWSVHIYYTRCDIILIFKPRSSIHNLKIQMMLHLCNKYDYNVLSQGSLI